MAVRSDTTVLRPPLGRRWMIPGGEEDEASVTLHVVVSDVEGFATKRYAIRLPLAVTGVTDLEVGTPRVEEA